MKEILVAGLPGAGIEILAKALESRFKVLRGKPC
jgi:hypothetical protein